MKCPQVAHFEVPGDILPNKTQKSMEDDPIPVRIKVIEEKIKRFKEYNKFRFDFKKEYEAVKSGYKWEVGTNDQVLGYAFYYTIIDEIGNKVDLGKGVVQVVE